MQPEPAYMWAPATRDTVIVMLTFDSPIFLVLLLPLAVAARYIYLRRPGGRMRFAALSLIPREHRTWRIVTAQTLPFLFVAALVLIVFGLARPLLRSATEVRRANAISIEMVVDISASMAEHVPGSEPLRQGDGPPTRLDVARRCFARFVNQRPDDLIGLITFAGYATTRAPLTSDHAALVLLLEEIRPAGMDGSITDKREMLTALGDGITTACARLQNTATKSKVAVLLTDGISNTGSVDTYTAMQVAERLEIRIYTIGLLSAQDQQDSQDSDLLGAIADRTGGRYFNVSDSDALTRALQTIDTLEKTEVEYHTQVTRAELFRYCLVPALGLLLITSTLSVSIIRRFI